MNNTITIVRFPLFSLFSFVINSHTYSHTYSHNNSIFVYFSISGVHGRVREGSEACVGFLQ